MSITDRTRKLLWGRAAMRCSICRGPLVIEPGLVEGEALIGEECHIAAKKIGEARWDPAYPLDYIDSYNNLILLCRNHHSEIDQFADLYPAQKLVLIKHQHEFWVRTTLSLDGGAYPSPIADVLLSRFSLPAVFAFLVERVI